MSRLAIVLAFTLLTGCATSEDNIPRDYAGADRGWLIVSIRTTNDNRLTNASLDVRSKDGALSTLVFYNGRAGQFTTPRDFNNEDENGAVVVRPLPAGDYEIHNVHASGTVGAIGTRIGSSTDFSIPFSIQPGRSSYVGSFKSYPTGSSQIKGGLADLFAGAAFAGVFFVVTDRSEEDIPIAKSKTAAIGTVELAVPDVDQIGSPILRSAAP